VSSLESYSAVDGVKVYYVNNSSEKVTATVSGYPLITTTSSTMLVIRRSCQEYSSIDVVSSSGNYIIDPDLEVATVSEYSMSCNITTGIDTKSVEHSTIINRQPISNSFKSVMGVERIMFNSLVSAAGEINAPIRDPLTGYNYNRAGSVETWVRELGGTRMFYWNGTHLGTTGATDLTSGGYLYEFGPMIVKEGSYEYYGISRKKVGSGIVKALSANEPRVRFIGDGWNLASGATGSVIRTSALGDFAEISFYGTGLNWLGLRDSSALRHLRVTIDGGAEIAANIYAAGSDVLSSRGYAANQVASIVSGLSLGWHTVKIRHNAAGVNSFLHGVEILNERTNILTDSGGYFSAGQLVGLSRPTTHSHTSGVTGSIGGRVVKYI
jgi:hypothetical protein